MTAPVTASETAAGSTALPGPLLIERHRPTLDRALDAIRSREYWSPIPSTPRRTATSRAWPAR